MDNLECEHSSCVTVVEDHIQTHSMWVVLQRVDKDGYTFFQCDEGQNFRFVNYQHFHCSHEHMQQGMEECINNDYKEEYLHPIGPGGVTALHKMVLGSSLTCSECEKPLDVVAYRFALTQGLPYHRVPDRSTEPLAEWCCSLEHAKQHAIKTIKEMEALDGTVSNSN